MPITQERFMTVIRGAKSILNVHKNVKDLVRRSTVDDTTSYNSVMLNCTDDNAKAVIEQLYGRLQAIRDMFLELTDMETSELIAIILAEEIHFSKNMRKNEKARYYQTKARRDNGVPQRNTEATLTPPAEREFTYSPVQEFTETATYNATVEKMRKKFWPDAKSNEEIIEKERIENAKQFGNTSLDAAAIRELYLMQQAQLANAKATLSATPNTTSAAKPELNGKSYDRTVLRTSVPTIEELNASEVKPGEDVL